MKVREFFKRIRGTKQREDRMRQAQLRLLHTMNIKRRDPVFKQIKRDMPFMDTAVYDLLLYGMPARDCSDFVKIIQGWIDMEYMMAGIKDNPPRYMMGMAKQTFTELHTTLQTIK